MTNIKVLDVSGIAIPFDQLSAENQNEVLQQMDMVSDVANLDISEADEIAFGDYYE